MIVYVATKNSGKFAELRSLFAGSGWDLQQHPNYEDVAEGDTSYAENAALKARALFVTTRRGDTAAAVLGDDSGLEVAALGDRPGVHSARYGGQGATWVDRRERLLAELAATGDSARKARFVCALHFIGSDGAAHCVQRILEGKITTRERGAAGFSYDPIFEYEPLGLTFGEMTDEAKNQVSHRALAAAALLEAVSSGSAQPPDFAGQAGNTVPNGT